MRSRTASTACKGIASSRRGALLACARLICETHGQGTVELALLLVAFVAVAGGLAAVWHLLDGGALVQHALVSASHCVGASIGAWADVLAY